jgi:phenylalanyl-tRNA synthetase beta chain
LEYRDEFEEALTCARGGADEDSDKALPEAERVLKIEQNDTNPARPLVHAAAPASSASTGGKRPEYPFFSKEGGAAAESPYRVVVDPALKDIRPYIAAFVISGKAIDDETLKDVIQTQEKLCWNYGRKRRSIAMGVYRTALMKWPVTTPPDPDATAFVPLGMEEKLSLRQIIAKHPKGQEYGHIVADFPKFPYLADDAGDTLSFPPVSTARASARWRSAIPNFSWR